MKTYSEQFPAAAAHSETVSAGATKTKSQIWIALIAIAALEAAFIAMARLGDLAAHIPEFMSLALTAGVLYLIAIYALEHTRERRAVLWIVLLGGLLFRLTLFPYPPSLSTDVHRYRWDGHVQNAGYNPYAISPTDPRLMPLRDPGWAVMPAPEIPTMYPPLSELVYRVTWRVLPGPIGFKLPFLLADLAVAAMLAGWMRATGGRSFQLAIYAWNPLVIVEFASSGHNDALAIAGVVATLLIIRRLPAVSTLTRGAPKSGGVSALGATSLAHAAKKSGDLASPTGFAAIAPTLTLTAGALAKAFPIVLLPLTLIRAGWPRRLRGWIAAGGCVALAALCTWPYYKGWREFLKMLAYYQVTWRDYHSSIYPVLLWFTGSHEIAAGVGEGVVLGLALWLALRRADPVRAAFLLIGTVLLVAPNGYSWYFTWIVPLLCFFPSPAWLMLTILEFLSYKIFINYRALGVWHFDPLFQWLCYAPFYAVLAWEMLRRRTTTAR